MLGLKFNKMRNFGLIQKQCHGYYNQNVIKYIQTNNSKKKPTIIIQGY